MQRRGFVLLLGATVIVALGALYALRSGGGTVAVAGVGERAMPDVAAKLDAATWMRLTRSGTTMSFAEIGKDWFLVEKGDYPADGARVRRLLLALADLELVEPKTARPALFPRLDVDDPGNGKATQVMIQDRTGRSLGQLIVGRDRPDRLGLGNDGVYVRRVGEERAWLARGKVDVSGETVDWLDRHILDIPGERIATMIFTGARQGVLVIGRGAMADRFSVDNAADGMKFKDDQAIAAPAAALQGLDLLDVKPAAKQPVPDSGVATAAFTTLDGLTVRLKLFESDKRDWVAIEAAGSGAVAAESKAINARVRPWVFAISPDTAKLLRTRLADLAEQAKGS